MRQSLQYNTFTSGLVTDFSDVNFPENALSECINMEIYLDGSIRRRRGLKSVAPRLLDEEPESVKIISVFPAYNGENSYVCSVWESGKIALYDLNQDYDLVASYSFTNYSKVYSVNFTVNSKGIFFSVYGDKSGENATEFFYIKFESNCVSSDITSYSILVRDMFGLKEEGVSNKHRPTSLSVDHKYNLQNQGWFKEVKDYENGENKIDVDYFYDQISRYPSLSDNPNLGLTVNAESSSEQRFRPESIVEFAYSDLSITARGSITYNPLDPSSGTSPSSSRTSPLNKEEVTYILRSKGKIKSDAGEVSGIEGYSSRIFYTGFQKHPALKGVVFYSKILEDITDAGVCYQEADPSSSTAPDPLDTDGGFISIPEAGDIVTIKTINKYLYVFANNGIWIIYGDPTSGGFSNLNYVVAKISDVPVYNKNAIEDIVGSVVFVGAGGIYTLLEDKNSGIPVINSIIKNKLTNWFRKLTKEEKENSLVKYDKENGKVYFIFNKTRVLILILDTGTFFEYQLKAPIDYVVPMTYMKTVDITDSNNGVQLPTSIESVPYSVLLISGQQICYFTNQQYFDLDQSAGSFDSYFSIGPYNFKELYHAKQAVRFITQMKRTETISHENEDGDLIVEDESSCFVQPVWDYSTDASTGKEGRWIQVYAPPRFVSFTPSGTYAYSVHQSKRKFRGSGKALKINVKSESNKHMHILGYALELNIRGRG